MKVFVIADNYKPVKDQNQTGWYFLTDSAVSNVGKPFYLPENMGMTDVSISVALRISRLGKGISPEFADRYYAEYAPAVHFTLPRYEETLKANGLPTDASRSFDRSLFVGEFIDKGIKDPLELRINGECCSTFSFGNLALNNEEIISKISRMNTLKIGDLVVPGLSGFWELKEGDFIEIFQSGQRAFHVKVK